MKGSLPKQHILADNHQIIEYTLKAFSASEYVDAIMVISNPVYKADVESLKPLFPKLKWVIEGGCTRIKSVENGIVFLKDICDEDDKIIISDAVRPCITMAEIEGIVKSLDSHRAVTTGVEVYETILTLEGDAIVSVIPRDGVVRQTSPEGYRFSALLELYLDEKEEVIAQYQNIGIDMLFRKGVPIGFVKSNPLNFKITLPEDMYLFEAVLKQGFDKIIGRRES